MQLERPTPSIDETLRLANKIFLSVDLNNDLCWEFGEVTQMTKAIFEYISLTKGKPVWDDEKVKAKTIKIFRAFGHDSKSCIK